MINIDEHLQMLHTYSLLKKEESIVGALVFSLAAGFFSIFILSYMLFLERLPMITLVLPGIVIGLCAKVGGNPFTIKVRLIPAGVALFGLLFVSMFFSFNPIIVLLSIPNGIVAYALSKRKLDKIQKKVMYKLQYNLINKEELKDYEKQQTIS